MPAPLGILNRELQRTLQELPHITGRDRVRQQRLQLPQQIVRRLVERDSQLVPARGERGHAWTWGRGCLERPDLGTLCRIHPPRGG